MSSHISPDRCKKHEHCPKAKPQDMVVIIKSKRSSKCTRESHEAAVQHVSVGNCFTLEELAN